ncbi:PTS lactose/cellobiose transporter subunit IIA [Lacticaseibacillus rhamnosus]|uniref:PTS lactose/cellobiose transporter subunit IIA n=1 Tax=Lacticaseibacillus rhamnosus TaxID=47715 RepID=UPI00057EFE82|nr:PTS lactose/cellobiose transporter subunit IIA [Lacticaseibacillus rhamnosus]KIC97965.1 PTS cellobiose transporter subunit IIA [Lacticaseibacillus rhamnosus]KMO51295.1 PTS cellobiose transporter subunit IIA [Lacticaseibacillus rhamnosus]MBE8126076.1 PTS lactose/cellobiose transporter subunit IIA [Lacticaseibacillus rhamnosus]MDI3334248.1 PTS lactose/cellobiose transporter subunit IIA [Lacticaseibacillus rhamnosus]QFV10458.1 PTS lactose/cellobiose transporter subunit IIA [Lacticaseibacillus 
MSNVNEQTIMGLIMAGGNAKSEAFEAIQAAKNSDFDAATSHLKAADEALVTAHNVQTDLLAAEANGAHADVSLLLVHAQDHLMNAITFRDLAGEVVAIYQRLAANTTVANETP